MAVRIVELMAKIGLDGSGFQQGARKVGHTLEDMGYSAKNLKHELAGAFSIYALERFAHSMIETAVHVKNMAEQMNISTDEVQTFEAAAIHSGQSIEDLKAPLSKLAGARKEAAEGNEDLRATFERFGITLADLQSPAIRNIDLMKKIADAMKGVNFSAREAADFKDLFGRSGQQLEAIFKSLDDVHISPISEDDINRIHKATTALEEYWSLLKRRSAINLAPLAEALNPNSGLKWFERLRGIFTTQGIPNMFSESRNRKLDVLRNYYETAGGTMPNAAQSSQGGDNFRDKAAEKLRKEILEQEQKLREHIFKLQLDTFSVAQKRAALEKEIKQHLQGAADAEQFGQTKLANEELEKALALQGELENLKEERGHRPDLQLSQFEQMGAASGITVQRALALSQPMDRNESPGIKATAKNTQDAAKLLQRIIEIIKQNNPGAGFF